MIEPTVGRIVYYYANRGALERQPNAAIICFVRPDGTLNLYLLSHHGFGSAHEGVQLVQSDAERPTSHYEDWCEWMPYQRGQAQKTEQLEKQLTGGAT